MTGQGLEKQFNVRMCDYIIGARKKGQNAVAIPTVVFQDPQIPRNEGVWLILCCFRLYSVLAV